VKKLTTSSVALAMFIVACGGPTVVATVDGVDIPATEVEELSSTDASAVPADEFANNLLNTIVEHIVIAQADAQYGISFTDAEIEQRRADLEAQIVSQSGGTYDDFLQQQGFTNERIYRIAHQQLVADAVQQDLVSEEGAITDQDLQDAYDAGMLGFTTACVSHILVPTEEEALAAKARIDGGESFAEVAKDVGTDGTAPDGGDLGCNPLDQYVPEFGAAALDLPLNTVSEPVKSQFGYHLILVTERTTQPFDDVVDQLRTQVETERSGKLLQDWLLEVVKAADVSVDEQYGTWVTDPYPDVQPPQ